MDTETVLKIIAMLNEDIDRVTLNRADPLLKEWFRGYKYSLQRFRNHLQSYIESQVNQVENEMNRGE